MKKKITVNVTKRDIKRGTHRHSLHCPHFVLSGWSQEGEHLGHVGLPIEAQIFINRCDNGFPVEPFKFTVEIEVPE